MKPFNGLLAALVLPACVGCAHTPDVTMKYYLAATKANFKVTRTIACDTTNKRVVGAADATPNVTHHADRSEKSTKEIRIADLRGFLANSDLKFEFHEDGRLKGVNATSTGQGETILKTALSLVSAARVQMADVKEAGECERVAAVGKGAPISLVYVGDVDVGSTEAQLLKPDTLSAAYIQLLPESARPPICAVVKGVEQAAVPVSFRRQDGDVVLEMRQPALVRIRIAVGGGPDCEKGDTVWDGKILSGQRGTDYAIPIPRAAIFGKQTFVLAVDGSGAATSVQYATETGAGQLLNVLSHALAEMQGEDARRAAAARAEADLIAAQQRLVRCRADPKSCS